MMAHSRWEEYPKESRLVGAWRVRLQDGQIREGANVHKPTIGHGVSESHFFMFLPNLPLSDLQLLEI